MLDIENFADTEQLFDNHYKLIRPLNTEGGSADVWLALDASTVKDKEALDKAAFLDDSSLGRLGLLVAIKVYRPKNALDIEGERRFRDEFMIVFNCNHTNLIHPVHFSIFEETPYLVVPYCKQGSSELMIGNFVNDDDIWKYIRDVAAGLDYLHKCSPPIIHQDIKPANILISDNGSYAITDFGISAKRMRRTTKRNNGLIDDLNDEDEYEEYSGTFAYMAPERFIEGNRPSAESDIWAFGATLYELITGQVPFGEEGGSVQEEGAVKLSFNGLKISDDIKRLIRDCLSKNPFGRPTSEQLLNAAMAKKYTGQKPQRPKSKLIFAIVGAVCAVALLVLGYFMMATGTQDDKKKKKTADESPVVSQTPESSTVGQEPSPSVENLFDDALSWADATSADSVKVGVKKFEELADKDYIPALYELAKTYGGLASDDELESSRKRVLGIAMGNSRVDDTDVAKLIPKSDGDNDKAIKYYTRIVELSNDSFSDMSIKAAYRLGNYYLLLKEDTKTALRFFNITKELAIKNGDEYMEEKASAGIEFCQDY